MPRPIARIAEAKQVSWSERPNLRRRLWWVAVARFSMEIA